MKPVFLDVRTEQEWHSGHLEGAIHIPLDNLSGLDKLGFDKSTPIYLYCRSGNRSAMALHILENLGYTNLHNAGSLEEATSLSKSLA